MEPTPVSSSVDSEEISIVYEKVPPPLESLRNLEDSFHVQHAFFKWSIENLSIFPEEEDILCYSPTFELKGTWWYLALCPNSNNCGRDCISVGLTRHYKDSGPDKVVASYALGLENSTNKIWFKAEENIVFKKGDYNGLQTSVLGNLQNFLSEGTEDDSDDNLSVVCEIYVSYLTEKKASGSSVKVSLIDQSLSSDLIDLFNSQKKVDVLIEIRNHRVWAHKSVLCARSKTLSRLLEGGKFFIQLSCSFSCLTCAIYYMYSGSFDYLARNATFGMGLYELACELCLANLREMLTPHRVDMRSNVDVRCFKRTCTLYEFSLEELSGQNIETPEGIDEESGMSVRMVLRKLDSPVECVVVDIEIGGVARMFHVDLNVSFLNKNCLPFREVPTDFLPDSSPEFKDSALFASFMISDSDIESCITERNLFINVECTKYSLRNVSDQPANLSSLPRRCRNWIQELSADLKKLFKSEKLTDITLVAEGQKFGVHRSILAARSRYFCSVFHEKNYLENTLGIQDTEPRILGIMLMYMYSGIISHPHELTAEDFTKLQKVAEKCKIQSLVEECAQFLNV